MPLTIEELTTEVVAEPDSQPVESDSATPERPNALAAIRADLSAVARQVLRTRAEGFDD